MSVAMLVRSIADHVPPIFGCKNFNEVACLLFLGLSYPEQYKISIYISSIVLLLMLMGYFMVYIISPHDLVWHLNTSLERLFLQLLPSAIFIFFVLLTTPEEMQINKSNG